MRQKLLADELHLIQRTTTFKIITEKLLYHNTYGSAQRTKDVKWARLFGSLSTRLKFPHIVAGDQAAVDPEAQIHKNQKNLNNLLTKFRK